MRLAVVLAVAALTAAPAAGAATRRQWVRSANAVCRRELARSHAVVRALQQDPPATVREWVSGFDRLIASFTRMHRGLGALPRPARDRPRIARMLSLLGRATGELRLVRRAELARDLSAYRLHMGRTRHYAQRADRLAVALGAKLCGTG